MTTYIKDNELRELFKNLPETEQIEQEFSKIETTDLDSDPESLKDYLVMEFLEAIIEEMKKKGMKRTELAEKIDKSKQYVSRILNEKVNFTLKSIADISSALDLIPSLKFENKEVLKNYSKKEEQLSEEVISLSLQNDSRSNLPSSSADFKGLTVLSGYRAIDKSQKYSADIFECDYDVKNHCYA